MDIHDSIEEIQKQLGYKVSPVGSCHGFSLRWLEACLLNEENIFDARILKIVNEFDTLTKAIKEAQKKQVKERTENDMQLLDIPAFYESLELYQMPDHHSSLFGAVLHQVDVKKISSLASSEKILSQGGLEEIASDIYSIIDVKTYLDELEQLTEKNCFSSEDTIGIVLASVDHTNAIIYTPSVGWKFMDINRYPSRTFPVGSTLELTNVIKENFSLVSENEYLVFNMSIFTNFMKDEKTQLLKELLGSLKTEHSKSRIIPEPEKAIYLAEVAAKHGDAALITQLYTASSLGIKNDNGITMHYIAAQNGHSNVIDALGLLGIDFDEANDDGATAVFIAAANDHGHVIGQLASYGANLDASYNNKTAVYVATYLDNFEAIKALADSEADFDLTSCADIPPPIFIAIEKGHAKILTYFIRCGADLNLVYDNATPLFGAALLGQTEIVKKLIKAPKTDLDISCIDSIDDLVNLLGDEVIPRIDTFRKKQLDLNKIKVTAYDIALIRGHDEIAQLIEQERDKRVLQMSLSQQKGLSFFEDQDPSLKKRKRQTEEETNKHPKEDRSSNNNTNHQF